MNKEQSEIERCRLVNDFESYIKQELPDTNINKSDDWMVRYEDKITQAMFTLYRAGWYSKQCDIITFGCPDLKRLFDMKHPNC